MKKTNRFSKLKTKMELVNTSATVNAEEVVQTTGKFRTFCWTDFDVSSAKELYWQSLECVYMLYGRETCPTTGAKHLQGFMTFKNTRSINQVRKECLTKGIYFRIVSTNGTAEQNITYCTKSNDFFEKGTRPKGSGKRTDLDEIKEMVKIPGITRKELYAVASGYQAMKMAEIGLELFEDNTTMRKLTVYWFWGPSACGKSETAYKMYPKAWKNGFNKGDFFFDGYDDEKEIIFEDFRGSDMKFSHLLRVLEGYPLRLNVKNGHRNARFTTVVITTPKRPEDTYRKESEEMFQLTRRITEIREFKRITPENGIEGGGAPGTEQRSGGNYMLPPNLTWLKPASPNDFVIPK